MAKEEGAKGRYTEPFKYFQLNRCALLSNGFDRFVRIGPVDKMDVRVQPYAMNAGAGGAGAAGTDAT